MGHLATVSKQSMAGPVVVLVLLATGTLAQLKVNTFKECGELKCEKHNYCRAADSVCSSCVEICDTEHHNSHVDLCESECQDYLHDLRYESKGANNVDSGYGSDYESLQAQIQSLKVVATIALIIAIFFGAIVLIVIVIWCKKKNILTIFFNKKQTKVQDKVRYIGDTPISTIRLSKDTTITLPPIPDAVLSNGAVTQPPREVNNMSTFKYPPARKDNAPAPPSSLTKSGPGVQRVPSEDSTFAYDNPALTRTPSPKSEKAGSTK